MTGALVAALLWAGCWLLHCSPARSRGGTGSARTTRQWPPSRPNPAGGVPQPGVPQQGLDDPALMMDLMASMLAVGSPLDRGLEMLARSASPPVRTSLISVRTALDLGASWEVAWAAASAGGPCEAVQELGRALRFAGTTGAPSAAVVTAHAAQFRRRRNRAAEQRAAALGVRLVVPLGLCSLPAFVCLGVIPILVGLFPAFTAP